MFRKLLLWNLRTKYWGAALALVLAGLGVLRGVDLPVRLSLSDLLPEHRDSVRDLKSVAQDVGGVGYLIILIGPVSAPESYLPKVAERLKKNTMIKYTFYEREEYLLRNKAMYLMPRKEFDDLIDAGKTLLRGGKRGPIDLGLSEKEGEEKAVARAKDRIAKLKGKGESRYFLSADRQYAMLLTKPTFDSEDLGKSKSLVEQAEINVRSALPENVPFKLVGRYIDKVNDTRQIERDVKFTGWFSMSAIFLVLVVGIGAFRGAFLTIAAVSVAMGWTVGAAHMFVGQINILTAFLLAILGGMGVEYGVHYIRRYYQERAEGKNHDHALQASYVAMARALWSAALASSGAFFILFFSDFRGFSELGVIAGCGVLSIYFVYLLVFPVIGVALRRSPRFGLFRESFGWYPFKVYLRWAIPPLALVALWGVWQAEFEYDFRRMHALSQETRNTNFFVNDLFGRSFTPAAVLAQSSEQARRLVQWLTVKERESVVKDAVSLSQLIPHDAIDRHEEMRRLYRKIARESDTEIREKTGIDGKKIRDLLGAQPPKRSDFPPQLNEAFGKSGNIVLVYSAKDLDYASGLKGFAGLLKQAREQFPGIKVGSDVRIFSEILDHITSDGLVILGVFLLGAFFVLLLDFRNLRDALELEAQLILGIVLLVGLMGLCGVRFSILNITMVPAVLAAGIDMGVHVRHREHEGFGALSSAKFVAQAVHVAALTTMIGFGALFLAEAKMLQGIAWISVLGQLSMYVICMVVWPVARGDRVRFRRR